MAAGGGGAWKVAYADFVTAMMAFFMVMWLVGQKDETKHAIAHYFQEPFDDQKAHAESSSHKPSSHKPHEHKGQEKIKSVSDDPHHPEARKSRILAIHGGDRAAFGTLINFEGDSVKLDDTGKEQLDLAIPKFTGIPHKIEIRGHVSNRSAASNDAWKLSYDRSLVVMAYLLEHGIEQNRIRLAQAGAYEPLSISGTTDAMERNSRVDVFLLEEFAEDTVGTPLERLQRQKADTDSHKQQDAGPPTNVGPPTIIYRGGGGDEKHDDHKKHDAHAPPAGKAKAKAAH